MSVLPSNQFGLWIGAQSAKGASATARKQLRVVSGQMSVTKEQGRETYGDGRRFSNASDYVTQVMGSGDITAQGTPGDLGFLASLMLGAESFTAADADSASVHVISPSENGGKWFTAWQSIGEGSSRVEQKYEDCRIGQLTLEASTGTPTMHAVASIMSLNPGERIDGSAPVVEQSSTDPLLFHEGQGQLSVDGTVYGEIGQIQVELNDQLTPLFGDDTRAFDMAAGRSEGTVTFTMVMTAETLPMWNKLVYGEESPAAGSLPSEDVYKGAIDFKLQRGADATEQSVRIAIPEIAFQPAPAIEFQADGGAVELSFSGEIRPTSSGTIEITISSTDSDDDSAYL